MKQTWNYICRALKNRNPFSWLTRLAVTTLLIFALSGCGGMQKKFTATMEADLGSFADNTIAMLSNVDISIKRNEAVYVRRYVDENGAEEKEMERLNDNMQIALKNIVDYSVALVDQGESDMTEQQKVGAYAGLLARFKEDIISGSGKTPAQFDADIEEIRSQPDFLAALRAAQPLVSASVIAAFQELKNLTGAIEAVANKMDAKIDAEYADLIQYQHTLEDEKDNILKAFEIIYRAYQTDNPDLGKLIESGVIWTPEIIPQGRPTKKDLQQISDHLNTRLDTLHRIREEISPYLEEFRASHRELDSLTDKTLDEVAKIRLILLVWIRAHQKMASGVIDSADWFDITNTPAELFRVGTRLL